MKGETKIRELAAERDRYRDMLQQAKNTLNAQAWEYGIRLDRAWRHIIVMNMELEEAQEREKLKNQLIDNLQTQLEAANDARDEAIRQLSLDDDPDVTDDDPEFCRRDA